jgi:ubiquinone/menaquinone biosynthesis C-methylase UbiE
MRFRDRLFMASDRHLKDVTIKLIGQSRMAPIFMDMGCGDCKFTQELVEVVNPNHNWFVVDTIDKRLEHGADLGAIPIKADLNNRLLLDDCSVNIIHAGDVIEHLNDTDTFIKEIKRILTPKGFVVISTPNLASWHNIWALLDGKQPETCMVSDEIMASGMNTEDVPMPKHRRAFTHAGLVKLLEFHGLKVESVKGAGFYPFTGLLMKFMAWYQPQYSAYVIVKARKNGK